ncbi:hypothetical protein NFI96_003554 [Prochilodus magdalenae]|nr:hypothetical protein NFI96_003554 [Prochilodus magdalenae]
MTRCHSESLHDSLSCVVQPSADGAALTGGLMEDTTARWRSVMVRVLPHAWRFRGRGITLLLADLMNRKQTHEFRPPSSGPAFRLTLMSVLMLEPHYRITHYAESDSGWISGWSDTGAVWSEREHLQLHTPLLQGSTHDFTNWSEITMLRAKCRLEGCQAPPLDSGAVEVCCLLGSVMEESGFGG